MFTRAVKERADIFILIIGARYGSQNESGKSITNLEYLEAKAKGIPVYVFVLKQVLNALPIWRQNKDGNYNGIIDTPKLFEFVEELYKSQDHWIFPFEEVLHINETLRIQFAHLFMDGLVLREKIKKLNLPPTLANLSGKSLKLLFERPKAWEYRFFSSVLADEMKLDEEIKWDLNYGLKNKNIRKFGDRNLLWNWIQQKLVEIMALCVSAEKLTNTALVEALREHGTPGDPEHLFYVARRLAQIRKAFLEWAIEFNCADVDEEYKRLLFLTSAFSKDAIERLENLPILIDMEITKALETYEKTGQKQLVDINVKIGGNPYQKDLEAEIQRFKSLPR